MGVTKLRRSLAVRVFQLNVNRTFLTSQLFVETEHPSFHSQFYDEAGVGSSAAPWLGWNHFRFRILYTISSTAVAAETQGGSRRHVKIKTQTNKQFQGAANMRMVKHKNKMWKIKTRKEHSEYGQDYQYGAVETKEGTL